MEILTTILSIIWIGGICTFAVLSAIDIFVFSINAEDPVEPSKRMLFATIALLFGITAKVAKVISQIAV